ncbi:methyl-viologen-reducing hydrogenase delta subunit [Thermodesulfatator indicus DSM 15286]|uniref:Methyl-viologen-reducing hydrogenase delta subunit n=1 Tax=Thermodesulfatator indicus (strain DSM 15286 / JCM 11887 / CIR29812) TaxID=667014 RepID=F8A9W9_THEID|nr:hydrogenase iron-sulfur subunit [Thermodesulfatator indicus]AEH44167.1 methyl-viologen-reducing hydrogenase delta subunit [Thermodesulfatator indicus DSM 15286]
MEKVGVFICTSCNIGDRLEIGDLEAAANEQGCAYCASMPFLCGKEGVEAIKKAIQENELDSVVICACSSRVNYDVFDFGKKLPVVRVSLREEVVWSRWPKLEEGQEMPEDESQIEFAEGVSFKDELMALAKDYVRMGVVKAQKIAPPEPYKLEGEICKKILVMGGGVAGLTAALEVAKAGYEALLVEKENELGGFVAKMKKQLEPGHPYKNLVDPVVKKLIEDVQANDKIQVVTGATVEKIAGAPGAFKVTYNAGGNEETVDIGAIVVATGWKPYDATKLEEPYGYGKYPDVVTNIQFEEMLAKGELKRPSDGSPVKSVAFIQCAGQRDENHLPYCSGVCCLASLKQAKLLREMDSEAKAYIFYKDMRTMGIYENFYLALQDDPGVFLTKAEFKGLAQADDGRLVVEVGETLLGDDMAVPVDLVVLATGMVPTTADDPIIPLEYRQGPGFPELELFSGYADSNYICFPYETRRTGIYAAGCVHQPMATAQAMEDAAGAALKAIQCLKAVEMGHAVHPRTWDFAYPEFNFKRCTQCKRCTEECPFGALDDDPEGTPMPNPTRCRRCGTCFGACPERVINFKDYNIDMGSSMLKACEMPEPEYGQYRVVAFICENDALPALDMAAYHRKNVPLSIRFIPVRCLGAVNVAWIRDAMSGGWDGVLMLGCKYGENYQCHFIKGSELANRRMENVAETLQQLALEPERVVIKTVSIDEYEELPKLLQEFQEALEAVGESPFKGW